MPNIIPVNHIQAGGSVVINRSNGDMILGLQDNGNIDLIGPLSAEDATFAIADGDQGSISVAVRAAHVVNQGETPQAGIGVAIDLVSQDASSGIGTQARIASLANSVTVGDESTSVTIATRLHGALADKFSINPDGDISAVGNVGLNGQAAPAAVQIADATDNASAILRLNELLVYLRLRGDLLPLP